MTGRTAEQAREPLTYGECMSWAGLYANTPWNMLALSTSADKQPSPLEVMRSLFLLLDAAIRERDEAASERGALLAESATLREALLGAPTPDYALYHPDAYRKWFRGPCSAALASAQEPAE